MILSVKPVGDYDKRIVILTKEKGKISAFAKNARRQNNQLMGVTNPFVSAEFVLYEGRTSYNLLQANVFQYFMELSNDYESAYYGFYFAEITEYYTKEFNDEKDMLALLYATLLALTKGKIPKELIRCIFELKTMVINGEYPDVFHCVQCGSEESLVSFSSLNHGMLCGKCLHKAADAIMIGNSTLYTLQFIVTSSVEKLYTFTVSETVLKDLKKIMKQYMNMYVDKKFKSLEILELCAKANL